MTVDEVLTNWHLGALLEDAAAAHGDRPYLTGAMTLTYREAAEQVRKMSRWMSEQGVGRGDRVLILLKNRPEIALLAYATAQLGAIFVVVNHLVRPQGLENILKSAEPKLAVLDEHTQELASCISGPTMLFVGSGASPAGHARLDDVLAGSPAEQRKFPGLDIDAVSLIYTSGSTGTPRGVCLSHDNIRFAIAGIQERLQYRAEDTIGVFLPLSFDYGLYQLFLAAQVGACVFVGSPDMAGPQLLNILDGNGVTVLPGVPTLFAAMLTMLNRRPHPLPKLRAVTNTGDRLPRAHVEQIRKLLPNVGVYLMFGLTECKRVSIMLPSELDAHPDAVGRPLTGTECRVVGDDGQPLAPGELGELVVRGRHVALGYWRAPEESKLRFRRSIDAAREMWSGDFVRMDADGFIYFHGRRDALLKHRGYRISPLEIEETACQIAGVSEAGVAQKDADGSLHLFVAVHQDGLTQQAIVDALRSKLEPVKVPDQVHVVDALPKTGNRKIDRNALKARLAS